jgi:DNA-directed RNA polymerase subunit N (RpoN/RPB10)
MGNIWEKLKENIERWETCGEHGQKCGKTYGNHFGQNLRRITEKKGKQWENICDNSGGNLVWKIWGNIEKKGTCGNHVGRMWQNRWQTCWKTLGRIWKNRKHVGNIWDIREPYGEECGKT